MRCAGQYSQASAAATGYLGFPVSAGSARIPGPALMNKIATGQRKYRVLSLLTLVTAVVLFAAPGGTAASESDPWTYAYIPLADASAAISDQLASAMQKTIGSVNASEQFDIRTVDDTALEFAFFAEFRSSYIRDLTWGMFERCIATNSCNGWAPIERIQMHPRESIYHEARWRFIPSYFHLASIVNICGVRMGADKMTHFFDDAFHYFNALRSKRKNLQPEDIRQLSMAFELSYMGTRITGIVSRADIEANLAGVQFYGEMFGGDAPMIGRSNDGRLVMLRNPDICDYVSAGYDERILPNEYSFSLIDGSRARKRARNLSRIIRERQQRSAELAQRLDKGELSRETKKILARRIPLTHWQNEFPRLRLAGLATGMATQWLFDSDFRRVSNIFGFNPLKPRKFNDRKSITIKRVDLPASGN